MKDLGASPRQWLSVSSAQLQGGRARQEDSYALREVGADLVALVADGLGGNARGDEASRIGCNTTADWMVEALQQKRTNVARILKNATIQAHRAVLTLRSPLVQRPATTLVGGIFRAKDRRFYGVNVGDSLAILCRDGEARKLFEPQIDQESGWLKCSLGADIGGDQGELIALHEPIALQKGDRVLLASDGIDALGLDEIKGVLMRPTAREACEALAKAILDRQDQYQDNATLIVVSIGGDS